VDDETAWRLATAYAVASPLLPPSYYAWESAFVRRVEEHQRAWEPLLAHLMMLTLSGGSGTPPTP
jgi:hypothetical protein